MNGDDNRIGGFCKVRSIQTRATDGAPDVRTAVDPHKNREVAPNVGVNRDVEVKVQTIFGCEMDGQLSGAKITAKTMNLQYSDAFTSFCGQDGTVPFGKLRLGWISTQRTRQEGSHER